ncbi:MAG TPA: glycogen synthase GlgA [Gammaproteobacteria bacterium]|jgi:starch synthase|nr:glycogen synthase GlgA [Gammaproteobacteria bacterium]
MKVLFATSEAYPLVKTGGLGDVAGHLPLALEQLGAEITVALPGYHSVLSKMATKVVAYASTSHGYALIREARLNSSGPRLWLVDHPLFSERPGAPYIDEKGEPWRDNSVRFGVFAQALAKVSAGQTELTDRFDIVHCNDWQTGLIPAFLSTESEKPATIFTIHNLAYQGIFPASCLETLQLPGELWSPLDGLVFHGQLSFIKGGLVFADHITTVSPSYAKEILTDAFSYGLAGLLNHRSHSLSGIINGIDTDEWNPQTDEKIPHIYSADNLSGKIKNKRALQKRMGLVENPKQFLIGTVARMVEQKGIDLIVDALPQLMKMPIQLVIAGTGNTAFEDALRDAMKKWPDKLSCHIGYDEELAHLIEAGSDTFLMPSRFEPCGLNQMYSLMYGTPPVVSRTGGLIDTVTDTTNTTLKAKTATGFFLHSMDITGLVSTIDNALKIYQQPNIWKSIQRNGMNQDFSWQHSAKEYIQLYKKAIE